MIHGINKLTLLDYPGKLACLVFTGSCNFRCPFCQNASLVMNPSSQPIIPEEEIFDFLILRQGVLEGVCISGGEPTLMPDLEVFIQNIKTLGYSVKLDTNGSRPDVLKNLISKNLLDYVAMDIKNSREHYSLSAGTTADYLPQVIESAEFLMRDMVPYEFRTTLVKEHHTPQDMTLIGQWLSGAKRYYLQAFKDSGDLIVQGLHALTPEEMHQMKELAAPYFETVELRGM